MLGGSPTSHRHRQGGNTSSQERTCTRQCIAQPGESGTACHGITRRVAGEGHHAARITHSSNRRKHNPTQLLGFSSYRAPTRASPRRLPW
eukprot:379320-Pleurochrysis_carterae.AAC.1